MNFKILCLRDLLDDERADILARVGADFTPSDPIAEHEKTADILISESLSVSKTAKILGVNVIQVRNRITRSRTLYGIKIGNHWRIPLFQFDDSGKKLLPGIARVISAIPKGWNPVEFYSWFTLPCCDLEIDDLAVSPRDWLLAGFPAKNVEAVLKNMG